MGKHSLLTILHRSCKTAKEMVTEHSSLKFCEFAAEYSEKNFRKEFHETGKNLA